jgi:LysR family transcriptional regulator, mexEF-oprN operon transcriptional activator
MSENYGRDLDLNLLRVFAVVAETGSVTGAAARLYLTQPAVSAALRRLATAVGANLFVRQGRGLALTSRGRRLLAGIHPHLDALVDAALSPADFDPKTSDRTIRLGLSDSNEGWLLPALLRALSTDAPRMKVISIPVQFRNVAAALTSGAVDAAVTVADEMPAGIRRLPLRWGGFVCLHDPRHARLAKRLTEKEYFAHDHVIVSYNGDLRGIVEDVVRKPRRIRCSVSSFAHVGGIVDGSALLATVPAIVADHIRALRPHLAVKPLPFRFHGAAMELLWPAATDDDDACRFVRDQLVRLVKLAGRARSSGRAASPS